MKPRFAWIAVTAAAVAALAVGQALAWLGPAAGATVRAATAAVTSTAQAVPLPLATGDQRSVRRPVLPHVCAILSAQLSTATGQFATADETSPPDTARLQAALRRCAGTHRAVELVAFRGDNSFLSGPVTIGNDETLVMQAGVTLYASRNPADYQIPGNETCGTKGVLGNGCRPFITITGRDSGVMGTRGPAGSLGVIDGRGEMTILGSTQTWWDVAESAHNGGAQNNPDLIVGQHADDVTIYQIELKNSPMYHIFMQDGTGLTVWGVMIDTPAVGARNTDGIDPTSETDVTLNDDMIQDGDDCVAVKSFYPVPASNITVENVHCYGTHGLSIGSQTGGNVTNVLFENDTVDGTDSLGNQSTDNNGIRIKADAVNGGTTQQVTYDDICETGIKHLLYFNTHYASGGTIIPSIQDVVVDGVVAVNSVHDAYSAFDGFDAQHPLQIDLENVSLDNTSQTESHTDQTDYTNAARYNSNIVPSGTGVTIATLPAGGSIPACTFPAFGPPPAAAG